MCGIVGAVSAGEADLRSLGLTMLEQIRYRGPDEGYLYLSPGALLGVRRLAIVSVDHGPQPAFSGDRQLAAIFNGEIYNHRQLKQELLRDGYPVASGSDAEVIPHAYDKWGLDFPSHLNGDFAIAIWDRRRRRLILARDRLGIKPLFYTTGGQRLLFASEIKALLADSTVERRFEPGFLAQVFTFWTGLDTGSPLAGVSQVEAGSVLAFDTAGQITARRKYWDVPHQGSVPAFSGDYRECQAALRSALQASVDLRLQADVDVGTYTSGGIDSAVINALACRGPRHRQMQTFSVAFEDPIYDESRYQRLVASHLGLASHELRVGHEDIYRALPDVVYHAEAPIFRTAPAPMFLLSKRVSETGKKVVLTGEGADEVAWGYDIFRETKLRRFWSRQPQSKARPQLFRKLYAYLPQFQNPRHFQLLVDFFRKDMQHTECPLYSHHSRLNNSIATHVFLSCEMRERLAAASPREQLIATLPAHFAELAPLEKCQYLEMRTLLHGYLLSAQGDRMLSAHGVEGRFPFLDHHVIEFLAGVPARFRLRGLRDKSLLRDAFRADLPGEILERPKFAFRAPELAAFVADPDGIVADHLSEAAIREAGVFDAAAVARFRARLASTAPERFSTRDNLAFVQMLSTQILHERFIRRFRPRRAAAGASDIKVTEATANESCPQT